MLSDLRVIDEPLDKSICTGCGLVRRRTSTSVANVFTSGYALYDHAPGAPLETIRQNDYASWIAAQLSKSPASVLDVGCGNGSLLLALRDRWPSSTLRGIDPSRESIAHARRAGIDALRGTLDETKSVGGALVISVNVLEHTTDPAGFIQRLTEVVEPGGTLIVVCPDGRRPWVELLFADHVWSFTPDHVAVFLDRAGWHIERVAEAPAALGPFMMIAAGRGAAQSGIQSWTSAAGRDVATFADRKAAYLNGWRALDGTLLSRSHGSDVVCFGVGEAAGLLRAYAPRIWSRVKAFAADGPEHSEFDSRPVYRPEDIPPGTNILLAVRPAHQDRLVARFQGRHDVIRWDDLIPA